jgi:hypothetical protein
VAEKEAFNSLQGVRHVQGLVTIIKSARANLRFSSNINANLG